MSRRPTSKGGNPLSQCGRQVSQAPPRPGATGGAAELPEWGSDAMGFGRDCLMEPLRQLGPTAGSGGGRAADAGGGGSGCNEASPDNPLAIHRHHPSPPVAPQDGMVADPQAELALGRLSALAAGDAAIGLPVVEWPCQVVQEWLEATGWGLLARNFGMESVDGEALLELRDEDLMVLGVAKLGDRKKLLKQIRLLRRGCTRVVSPVKRSVSVSFEEELAAAEAASPYGDTASGYYGRPDARYGLDGLKDLGREALPGSGFMDGGVGYVGGSDAAAYRHAEQSLRQAEHHLRGAPTMGAAAVPDSNEPPLDNPPAHCMPRGVAGAPGRGAHGTASVGGRGGWEGARGAGGGGAGGAQSNEPSPDNPMLSRSGWGSSGTACRANGASHYQTSSAAANYAATLVHNRYAGKPSSSWNPGQRHVSAPVDRKTAERDLWGDAM